jgi:hypothetical protein
MTCKTWKEESSDRRDERNTKVPDEPQRPIAGRKNKKKWCRGKVGVEHKSKCMSYAEAKNISVVKFNYKGNIVDGLSYYDAWKVLVCSVCGKELDYYHNWNDEQPKPDWIE